MRYLFSLLLGALVIAAMASDALCAERVFTDSDLQEYGGGSSAAKEETIGKGSGLGTDAGSADEQKSIQLCRNAVLSGITVDGRYSGVKRAEMKDLTPSSAAEDLRYIIGFDAHLETDVISQVECWVYKKENGQLLYRIIARE
jgi:hypothetical protein